MAGGAARLALLLCVGALLGGAVAASVAEQIKELLKLKESGEARPQLGGGPIVTS
jgi:hypothetical protein